MKDKWDEIKDYVLNIEGPVNFLEIHHKTGISRSLIRKLISKYSPETKSCHRVINWEPIEVEIHRQRDKGEINDTKTAEMFGVPKVTIQSHRLYKMGVGVRHADFMVIGDLSPSFVNTTRDEIVTAAVNIKRNNLGLSEEEMKMWLCGPAGQDFLTYLSPPSWRELDYQRICRLEAA